MDCPSWSIICEVSLFCPQVLICLFAVFSCWVDGQVVSISVPPQFSEELILIRLILRGYQTYHKLCSLPAISFHLSHETYFGVFGEHESFCSVWQMHRGVLICSMCKKEAVKSLKFYCWHYHKHHPVPIIRSLGCFPCCVVSQPELTAQDPCCDTNLRIKISRVKESSFLHLEINEFGTIFVYALMGKGCCFRWDNLVPEYGTHIQNKVCMLP